MQVKFNPKIHNRESIRLIGHDYGEPGLYFITICSKNRRNLFGQIIDGKMVLSDIGKIVQKEWEATKIIRPNTDLDEYVIMPNHLHGIIEIKYKIQPKNVGIDCNQSLRGNGPFHKYGPQSNNLFAIIRGFKGAATKKVNMFLGSLNGGSIWQSRFYDHIIVDENSYNKITNYIYENPANWESDLNNLNFINKVSTEKREKIIKEHYADLFGVT